MTRSKGYALLTTLLAVVAIISTAILARAGKADTDSPAAVPQPRSTVAPASVGSWIGTWSASVVTGEPNTPDGYPGISIRNVIHTSIGGTATRIHLSNAYGTQPLVIGHATLAVAAEAGSPTAAYGTMRALTFATGSSVTIPVGSTVVSDLVRVTVPAAADLLVTTYSPTASGPVTYHPNARQTSYLAEGEHTSDTAATAYTQQSPYWRYVSAVDVWTANAAGAVVVLGDSITDGITSTVGADHRWTDFLAARLLDGGRSTRLGVLNQGISGNRLLSDAPVTTPTKGISGLNRLDRDALSQAGARTIVVELGINDLLRTPKVTQPVTILSAMKALTAQAHARGLRVVGGTLMPFEGHRGFDAATNAVREEVNTAIRAGGIFDDMVDFDRALRDPDRPERLLPLYDSGDHLHPSDDGYQAMADAVDLKTLTKTTTATAATL